MHFDALKGLFLTGRKSDARLLRRVSALCNAAHTALRDPYCSAKLARMTQCAAVWFTGRRTDRAERYLEQLFELLDLLHSRVHTIEAIRRASRV